ncbi:MAG TPA: OmpA family protein [Caldimonas sp.]|jgi:OOP family OmpA-OmpF porin
MSHSIHRATWAALVGAAMAASWPAIALAQASDTTLLRGRAVTEANVLDALTPAAPEEKIVTRSLRVSPDSAAAATLAPRKKPSASLLITFETNSATLTARAKEQLDVVAAALKNDKLRDFTFNVEGHADPRGSAEGNLMLSQQRADSVRSYFVTAHGVAESRLKAIGKGDTEPLNTKDLASAENRRVTIVTNAQ